GRGQASSGGTAVHAQLVVHVDDAGNLFGYVFNQAFLLAVFDRTDYRNLAARDFNFHVARVDLAMLGEQVANFFANALVGAPVAFRRTTGVTAGIDAAAIFVIHFCPTLPALVGF